LLATEGTFASAPTVDVNVDGGGLATLEVILPALSQKVIVEIQANHSAAT
jgi:hypothetical protein